MADRLLDAATKVMFSPLVVACKLPSGLLRFIGMIAAAPFVAALGVLVSPLFVAWCLVCLWDWAAEG